MGASTTPRSRHGAEDGFTLVELLVVMLLLGVIGATTTGVVISTLRTEQFQGEMQAVMDDGRIALQRIRKEVRAARQVYETSCRTATVCAPSTRLHVWVDQNQDLAQSADEVICYHTDTIGPNQYELVRWTAAQEPTCTAGARPSGAQVVARTLVANVDTGTDGVPDIAAPFVELEPIPTSDVNDPATRNVGVFLALQVVTGREYEVFELESIIRLRNVA